jgi:hypothetical protein
MISELTLNLFGKWQSTALVCGLFWRVGIGIRESVVADGQPMADTTYLELSERGDPISGPSRRRQGSFAGTVMFLCK